MSVTDFAMFAPGEDFWMPTKEWAGRDVFIIGGGPSLRGFDFNRLRGLATIGCNSAVLLGAEVCGVIVFSDKEFFNQVIDGKAVRERLKAFPGLVVTTLLSLHVHRWLKVMRREDDRAGLSLRGLTFAGCSGGSAINLALLMGAKRVYLLGFDCKVKSVNQPNWHDHHRMPCHSTLHDKFTTGFKNIAASLPKLFPGTEIINLGPDSALECFPKQSIDEVISHAHNRHVG